MALESAEQYPIKIQPIMWGRFCGQVFDEAVGTVNAQLLHQGHWVANAKVEDARVGRGNCSYDGTDRLKRVAELYRILVPMREQYHNIEWLRQEL